MVDIVEMMKKKGYWKNLEEIILSSGNRLIGKRFDLPQDNGLKHTSRMCLEAFTRKGCEKRGKIMTGPPQFPYLNLIEL